jgi:Plasmid pRiA4b ORF-3-like protein
MSATIPFKRLILRAVLRDVSPMVARLISVNEDTELSDLHDVFQQVLGWGGDLGYPFRPRLSHPSTRKGAVTSRGSAS